MDDFKNDMKGIWTTCVAEGTIDEAPRAYKKSEDVLSWIEETVEIVERLKTVYNFKAGASDE